MNVPITTSALVDSACRRVLDLTGEGLPEIPILGMNRSVRTTEGSIFHRHASMEITYCVSGSVKFDCGGRAYPIMPGGDVHFALFARLGQFCRRPGTLILTPTGVCG